MLNRKRFLLTCHFITEEMEILLHMEQMKISGAPLRPEPVVEKVCSVQTTYIALSFPCVLMANTPQKKINIGRQC